MGSDHLLAGPCYPVNDERWVSASKHGETVLSTTLRWDRFSMPTGFHNAEIASPANPLYMKLTGKPGRAVRSVTRGFLVPYLRHAV